MQSKIKPKTTKLKEDDKEQSARFITTARDLEMEESPKKFDEDFKKIVPPSIQKKKES